MYSFVYQLVIKLGCTVEVCYKDGINDMIGHRNRVAQVGHLSN